MQQGGGLVADVDHLQGVAQLQTVQARVGESPGAQVHIPGQALRGRGMVRLVPIEHGGDQVPELRGGKHAVGVEDPRQMPQHAVEHVGEHRQRLLMAGERGTVSPERSDARDAHGQRALAENGRLLADVLHEGPGDDVVAHAQDEVLSVRHEHHVVREQGVHQRVQVCAEVAVQPFLRGEAGGADQLGDQSRALVVAVQQSGHRERLLAVLEQRHGVLPPQRGEHLAMRIGAGRAVVGIPGVAERGPFAQHREARVGERGILRDQCGDPVVDRGGVAHVVRGESAQESHVLDRERDLHVRGARAGAVEEGAQGLLRLELVTARAQRHQVIARDVRCEGDRQAMLGLPGVQREQVVVRRVEPAAGEPIGERIQLLRAERLVQVLLLVEPVAHREMAQAAPRRDPEQARARPGLGSVRPVIAERVPDAPVVGQEPGVPLGHGRLDRLQIRPDEFTGCGPTPLLRIVEFRGAGGEGRGELLEIGGEQVLGDAERFLQVEDQLLGVQRLGQIVHPAHDRGLLDQPVLQRQHTSAEGVDGLAELEEPAALDGEVGAGGLHRLGGRRGRGRRGGRIARPPCVGLHRCIDLRRCVGLHRRSVGAGCDQAFVSELRQGLGDQVAVRASGRAA